MRISRLIAGAIAGVLLIALFPGGSQFAYGASVIEEIVVTARKREENVQDVPVAVTLVTGETMDRSGIQNFAEASALTPGLNFTPSPIHESALIYTIRGSVQPSYLITDDPSVGVYVDDVFISRPFGVGVDLLDVKSVQVLKGPQGTLFGRNSTAGAVLLQTNDAEVGEFSADAKVTYGTDHTAGSIVLNVPLGDQFAIRGAYQKRDRENYIDNIANDPNDPIYNFWNDPVVANAMYTPANTNDNEIGGFENEVWRIKAGWQPTDTLNFQLSYEETENDSEGPARELNWLGGFVVPVDKDDDTISMSYDPRNYADTETWIFDGTMDTDIGQFKLVYSHREYRVANEVDLDGGDYAAPPIDFVVVVSYRRHGAWGRGKGDQDSVELQWTHSLLDGKLDLTAGALWFDEFSELFDYSYGLDPFEVLAAGGSTTAGGNMMDQTTESLGFYMQGSYALTDRLNLTAGLRYTDDEKDGNIVGNSSLTQARNLLPTWDFDEYRAALRCGRGIDQTCPVTELNDTWDSWDWLLSVDYAFSDAMMGYVKASTGFRAGGFNGRGSNTPDTPLTFGPEDVLEFEVGLKADLLDGRLRWNTAVFTNETKDKQFSVSFAPQNTAAAPGNGIKNAGKAESSGFETELTLLLTDDWSLGGTWAYVDAKVKEAEDYDIKTGITGPIPKDRLPLISTTPEHEVTVSLNYDHDFSNLKVAGTVLYHWIDEFRHDTENPNQVLYESEGEVWELTQEQVNSWDAARTSDSLGRVNASVTVSSLDDRYSLTLWGRNVFDKRGRSSCGAIIISQFYQYSNCVYSEPATFGATLGVSF